MAKLNKTKLYAQALAEILAKKGINEEKVIKNFASVIPAGTGASRKASGRYWRT